LVGGGTCLFTMNPPPPKGAKGEGEQEKKVEKYGATSKFIRDQKQRATDLLLDKNLITCQLKVDTKGTRA